MPKWTYIIFIIYIWCEAYLTWLNPKQFIWVAAALLTGWLIGKFLHENVEEKELKEIINKLPNNKASSLSKITYKMIKQYGIKTKKYIREILNDCFALAKIPKKWKEAIIYPISKNNNWNTQLINT